MNSLASHFQMLARYNSVANGRLFQTSSLISDEEYRAERPGSFRSIHRTLNHILLADRIWMGRFTSTEITSTPPLNTVLYENFEELWNARRAEDARIEEFTQTLTDEVLERNLRYYNSAGIYFEDPICLAMAHLFNHQTHHRGQVHVMLSETSQKAPNLDMHRAIHPA